MRRPGGNGARSAGKLKLWQIGSAGLELSLYT